MLKTILQASYASYVSRGNRLIYFISKIPLFGRLVKDTAYRSFKGVTVACVLGELLHILWQVVKTAMYVAVFMLAPRYIFIRYSATGVNGFALDDCFVYFTLVMSCFCGSINNSRIFKVDKESFVMLRELKYRPKDYFRMMILRKSLYEMISFWLVFSVFGMNVFKAFYLTLVLVLSRFVGDAINILIFRTMQKSFPSIRGASVVVMLLSLLMAYFVPYLRGCVPGEYHLIFNMMWMLVILILSAFFIYYIWNYNGYQKIASVIFTKHTLESSEEIGEISPVDDDYFEKYSDEIREKVEESKGMGVYRYANRIMFRRDRRYIARSIMVRLFFVAVIFVAAVVMIDKGLEDGVYKAISYSMPVLVFVMYAISSSGSICRRIYYRCDIDMLKNGYYRRTNDIISNYIIRLGYLIVIDLVPAVALAAAYAATGVLIGKGGSLLMLASLCVEIIFLSCFFTMFNVLVYYIAQPYREDPQEGSVSYTLISLVMYVICALFIYVNGSSLQYALGACLAFGVILAFATMLVSTLGHRTFKNRK